MLVKGIQPVIYKRFSFDVTPPGKEIEAVPMDVIPKEFFEKNSVGSMQAQHARWCE